MPGSPNQTSPDKPAVGSGSIRTPFITVAICTRNRAEFLVAAVRRLLPQMTDDTELLIVDNASTDVTRCVAAELAASHRSVRTCTESKPGISVARNTALAVAEGQYVLFFDDDQFPADGWLEAYRQFLRHPPSSRVAAVGGAILPQVEGVRPKWFDPLSMTLELGPPARKRMGKTSPGCGNCAYDRQATLSAGGFCVELDRYEECDLNVRLQRTGHEIWWLPDAAIHHRIPANRLRIGALSRTAFAEGRAAAGVRLRGFPNAWSRRTYRVARLLAAPLHFLITASGAAVTFPFQHGRTAVRLWQRAARIAGFALVLFSRQTPRATGQGVAASVSPVAAGWLRFREVVRHRATRFLARRGSTARHLTFLIPHHNAAEFLEVALHAVRRNHPDSQIVVADSTSAAEQYLAAKSACRRFDAELIHFFFRHGHAAQLNFLMRRARADVAVFLDQDCVLLSPLTPLFGELQRGKLLIGPRDEMRLTHPNLARQYPGLVNENLRHAPAFVHASLMITEPSRILDLFGRQPFYWNKQWNAEPVERPFQVERYYGLCERLRRLQPDSLLLLDSRHAGYGLGMVYLYGGTAVAYHHWYSGRVYKLRGKIDAVLDTDWLRAEATRFIQDYWQSRVELR
jgi:glycosyltransferase involved in cell wall biosynthesis